MKDESLKYNVSNPHRKDFLTTPLGRRIDEASYFDLFLFSCFVWELAYLYFYCASFFGHGMETKAKDWDLIIDTIYFTGVTLTTLGYGDISPTGFGKIVAVLTAMSGLTVMAALIAKISSERQSSILLLIHTSDIERRMSEYVEDVDSHMKKLRKLYYSGSRNDFAEGVKELRVLIEVINKYMTFHINQSLFLEIGTESAIKKLLIKLAGCHDVVWGFRDSGIKNQKVESALYGVSARIGFIESMLVAHNEAKGNRIDKLDLANLCEKHKKFEIWSKNTITEKRLNDVLDKLPCKPRKEWPRHVHKKVATELGLSNAKVIECIDQLKASGRC